MSATSLETIKHYYGRVLASSADLKTSACCAIDALPAHVAPLMGDLHEEVLRRFYGCGSPIPLGVEGLTILDLGAGSGRDCFLLSRLVGEDGRVIGVDMTGEQLDVARRHIPWHTERFGYRRPNVEFRDGYIEDLEAAGIASGSVDVVISNCVLNLSPDKGRVFSEIFRVLRPGGELFFSDVFADRRLAAHHREDPVLLGECLGGALYREDFRRLIATVGCRDARVVSKSAIAVTDPDIARKTGLVTFTSETVRAFKLALEDRCEDYGQVATYLGTLRESPHAFVLDDHHRFEAGRPMLVCSNTAAMLTQTRYAPHFRVAGDTSTHFGLFDCGPATSTAPTSSGCC